MSTLYDYGPVTIDIRMVQGDNFSMIVDVEGDRDADAFAAALRPKKLGAIVAFTTSVGAYDAGTLTTPVTITMDDSVSILLTPGLYDWDLEWTTAASAVRTIAAGTVTVLDDVTA